MLGCWSTRVYCLVSTSSQQCGGQRWVSSAPSSSSSTKSFAQSPDSSLEVSATPLYPLSASPPSSSPLFSDSNTTPFDLHFVKELCHLLILFILSFSTRALKRKPLPIPLRFSSFTLIYRFSVLSHPSSRSTLHISQNLSLLSHFHHSSSQIRKNQHSPLMTSFDSLLLPTLFSSTLTDR